jgi:hypothetical protein
MALCSKGHSNTVKKNTAPYNWRHSNTVKRNTAPYGGGGGTVTEYERL